MVESEDMPTVPAVTKPTILHYITSYCIILYCVYYMVVPSSYKQNTGSPKGAGAEGIRKPRATQTFPASPTHHLRYLRLRVLGSTLALRVQVPKYEAYTPNHNYDFY